MKFKKSKKGILIGETLKIIIGVLAIVLLITFAAKLFGLFSAKTEIEQAKEQMDILEKTINGLKEGDVKPYVLLSPNNWVLTGWPSKGYINTAGAIYRHTEYVGEIPNECLKYGWEKCICLCESKKISNFLNWCQENSICKEIKADDIIVKPDANGEKQFDGYFNIGSGIEIKIGLKNNVIYIDKK